MACFHPLDAWQLESGEIVFAERGAIKRPLLLPCGRCIGCRLVRQRSWAIRCMHEAQMHEVSSFITLTFDDDNYKPSLDYSDFQKFMRRLIDRYGSTRFFVCGEYGDQTLRPHYHALLFGRTFDSPIKCGESLYRSASLERLWPYGFSSYGAVTYESASYCAGYACKKISGARAESHYTRLDLSTGELVRVVPEFGHMSLKPGIGYTWFQKYWKEVFLARDGVMLKGGIKVPAPRYYDNLLMNIVERDPTFVGPPTFEDFWKSRVGEWRACEIESERMANAMKFEEDNTAARLAVREKCAIAKRKFNNRSTL